MQSRKKRLPDTTDPKVQSLAEELANSLTHGLGLFLSIAGLVILLIKAVNEGTAWHTVSVSLYGASLVVLYLISTIYHCLPQSRAKDVFNILDHCSIYVMIAGCYAPFTLVTLRGGWGWSIMGVAWAMMVLGIVLKVFWFSRTETLGLILYLSMGWLIVVALVPLVQALPLVGFCLLLAGGISFSTGVFFFRADRMRFNHSIWHLFVLAGTACHFLCVFFFVLPKS